MKTGKRKLPPAYFVPLSYLAWLRNATLLMLEREEAAAEAEVVDADADVDVEEQNLKTKWLNWLLILFETN